MGAALVLLKASVSVFASLAVGSGVGSVVYFLVLAASGLAWLWLFELHVPFFAAPLNAAQGAAAAIFAAAAACGVLSCAISGSETSASSTGLIVWLMTIPTACQLGVARIATRYRITHHVRGASALDDSGSVASTATVAALLSQAAFLAAFASPYAVEIRARCLLSEAGNHAVHDGEGATVAETSKFAMGGGNPKVFTPRLSAASSDERLRRLDEDTAKCAFHKRTVPATPAALVDSLFATARLAFPTAAVLDLFAAAHFSYVLHNSHLAHSRMCAAASKAALTGAWDVRFFVWAEEQDAEEASRSEIVANSSAMSVQLRMRLEEDLQHARQLSTTSRTHLQAFWASLCETDPRLVRVIASGEAFNASCALARSAYEELVALSPQSVSLSREFATFLYEQANDPSPANALLESAELAERASVQQPPLSCIDSLAFMSLDPSFDLSSESLACLRVSALDASLGIVIFANAAALELVGFTSKNEGLVGLNINTVCPNPIGAVHDRFLSRFKVSTLEERTAPLVLLLPLTRPFPLV